MDGPYAMIKPGNPRKREWLRMPLVSVIIPVYNAQKCLPACMDSVLGQDFRDLEVILVNDGSRDNSLRLCERYAALDARVTVIDQKNGGPGAARNAGLRVAKGQYLQFVDSDDALLPGATGALVKAIEGHDLAIAHFQLQLGKEITDRGLIKQPLSLERRPFLDTLIKWPGSYFYSALWNKLYSRELVERQGLRFEETVIWGEDCLFNMYYYHHVQRVNFLPMPVYRYRRKVSGLSWGSVFQLHKGIRIKHMIYSALKSLYQTSGLYEKYYWQVQKYILNVTLND